MRHRISLLGVAALLLLTYAGEGRGAILVYTGTLSQASVTPPSGSPGTGSTTVTYDSASHLLHVVVSFSGLTSGDTAAHIHCCTAVAGTGTAAVATTTPTFAGFPSGVTSGTYDNVLDLTLSSSWNPTYITNNGGTTTSAEATLAAGLAAGTSYLNIHTSTFPGGEIAAFLVFSSPVSLQSFTAE